MSPTRVLVVISSTNRRGAEIEATELASRLQSLGDDVDVVALTPGDGDQRLPVRTLGRRALGLSTLRALRRASRRADVVLAYGSKTLPACALALGGLGVPFVYRSIGDPSRWVRGGWHRRLTGVQFRRASHVVALWCAGARAIHSLYGLPESQLTVIPNARDTAAFSPPSRSQRAEARARFQLDDDVPVVAFIGTFAPEKRLDLAIRSVGRTPAHVLLVAGDGPDRQVLIELARRIAPSRVRFVGELADVRPVLHAADALLITSATEGMPGAALEAMLCGLPVVSTRVGALAEMPGVTTVAAAEDSLASALAAPGPAPEFGALDQFTWPSVAPRWQCLLHTIARRQSSRKKAGRRLFIPREIAQNLALGVTPLRRWAQRRHETGIQLDDEMALTLFSHYCSLAGGDLKSSSVLELGPGRGTGLMRAAAPNVASYAAFDVEPYLTADQTSSLGVDYRVDQSGRLPWDAKSFDVVWSESVFEHVRDPEITLREVARVLRDGGVHIANIDLQDHYGNRHDAASMYRFLRYGDRLWSWMTKNRSSYCNRLRASDWRALFAEAGFELTAEDCRPPAVPLEELRKVRYLDSVSDADLLTAQATFSMKLASNEESPLECVTFTPPSDD